MIGTSESVFSMLQYIRYQENTVLNHGGTNYGTNVFVDPTGKDWRTHKKSCFLEQGYTIREIQGAFGFENPQAIYKWLSGKSLPSIDNFIILSRLLHTSIEDILVIDGDIPHLWGILNRWLNDICHRMIYNRIRSK